MKTTTLSRPARAAVPALALAVALGACGGKSDTGGASAGGDTAASGAAAPRDTAGMAGMPGMGGMMQDSGAAGQMESHMRMMHGASGDSLKAMLPMHRQMAANMIAQFNKEMRDMNMTTDAPWNALVDSLRQDLRAMPEMSAPELQGAMPAHGARLSRLMEMHRGMMKNMKM